MHMKSISQLAVVSVVACVVASTLLLAGCSSTPDKKDRQVQEEKEPVPTTSAQEFFIQANGALDQQDFDKAIRLYENALEQDEARWDIHMNKAIAHSANQQFSKAVASIDQALANGGDKEAQVYFNLGNIYQNRGLYAQSVKAYRTSLAVSDTADVDTLLNLGAALALMREYDKSRQTYEHLQSRVPDDPRVYMGLGVVAHAEKNRKKALEQYEQAIRAEPDFAQVWFNKAALLNEMNEQDDAIAAYQRYVELAPDGPYAKRARGRIQRLKGTK
jgi:tetratricopeptide (TPR) repeat protein